MKKIIFLFILTFIILQTLNCTTLHHPIFGWWHQWSGWWHEEGPDNNASQTWYYESQNGNHVGDNWNRHLAAEVEHLVQEYTPSETGIFESTAYSPNINCSDYSDVILTFNQNFFVSGYQHPSCPDNYQIGKVIVSNGTDTDIYAVYETDRADVETIRINISDTAANQSNVRIKFYYKCAFFNMYYCGLEADSYWLISDLYVDGYNINETPGKCLELDGEDDFVVIPNESDYDFTNAMTVEAWIKVDEFDRNWQAIVTKGDSSWRLQRHYNTNNIEFAAGGVSIYSTTEVNDGKWHHIVGIHLDGITMLMIDGKGEAMSWSAGSTPTNDHYVAIGQNEEITNRYFDGQIDEVRIWNTFRTVDEIRENMHLTLQGNEPGLVSYFQFDQFTDIRACDVVGYNDGFMRNGISRSDSSSPFGSGTSFTHLIDSASSYDFTDTGLIMNVNSISGSGDVVISKITNAPNLNPDLDEPFDNQYWIVNNFEGINSINTDLVFTVSEDIVEGEDLNSLHSFRRENISYEGWTFESAAVNANAAGDELTFAGITDFSQFTLGRADVTTSITSLLPEDDEQEAYLSDDLVIEFSRDVTASSGNIHIYNSDDTIFETISASSAVCNGNEVTFAPINNLALNSEYYIQIENDAFINPYGNGFTIDDNTTWNFRTKNTDTIPGMCFDLNGTDNFAQIDACVIPASGDFTVSLWAKANPTQTGYREIISQNAGTGEDFYIGRTNSGHIRVGDNWSNSGVPFPTDGDWHYYTVVKTDSETKLYLDNYLMVENTTTIQNPAGTEFRIGRQYGAHSEYFMGQIDEIKVWDTALTSEEITAEMNLVTNGTEANLTSYYQFYESTSDRVIDLVSSYNSSTNNCTKISSSVPVGFGSNYSLDVTALGSYDFQGTDVSILVTMMEATTNVTVNKIENAPNIVPDVDDTFDLQYWVFYETICVEGSTTFYPAEDLTSADEADPSRISLYIRDYNSEEEFEYFGVATAVNAAANSVTFPTIGCSVQMFIGRTDQTMFITETFPTDNETGVLVESELSITFNRNVILGNAYLTIYNYDDDSEYEIIEFSADDVDGKTVTIEPYENFPVGSHFYILINDDAFLNSYGNYYPGIYNKNDWDFTIKLTDGFAGSCFEGSETGAGLYVQPHESLLISDAITFECWFYKMYPQNPNACFFSFEQGYNDAMLVYYRYDAQDFLVYPVGCTPSYLLQFPSPMQTEKWYHIAVTYDGAFVKVYVDGTEIGSEVVTGSLGTPNRGLTIGSDTQFGQIPLTGKMDEVRLWNIARTESEIRENMHIPLLGTETGLVSYWQMNELVNDEFIDIVSANNAVILLDGDISDSDIPFGSGSSFSETVDTSGTVDFTGTDLSLNFNSISAETDFTVTKLNVSPNLNPVMNEPFDNQYWIVHKYGNSTINADMILTPAESFTTEDENDPTLIKLYSRESTSAGDWIYLGDAASVDTVQNKATFSGLTDFSQMIIGRMLGTLEIPQNIVAEIVGANIEIVWDEVAGANSYIIYSSDNPYTGFSEDTGGIFTDTSWTAPAGSIQKYFYVVASSMAVRSGKCKTSNINRREKGIYRKGAKSGKVN